MNPYMRKWERSVKIRKLVILQSGHITASLFTPGNQKRKDSGLNVDNVGTCKEDQMDRENNNDKAGSPLHVNADVDSITLQRDATLTFLDSAKTKANTMLKVDSWIYNEIMGLKKKVELLQQNQDTNRDTIKHLEIKMRDIP